MASIHQLNGVLAAVRGVPLSTMEAYSRFLRVGGVLPETKRGAGATPPTFTQVGQMLSAVMRGSPSAAAENAREVGDLIVDDGGALTEPILRRQIAALNWPDNICFAHALGWFVERFVCSNISDYAQSGKMMRAVVDRYRPFASISWYPSLPVANEYIEGWRDAFGELEIGQTPRRLFDGHLADPMTISFASRHLHEAKVSYGVDREQNRLAHSRYKDLTNKTKDLDLFGQEWITDKTLIAISEIFAAREAKR